MKKSLAIAFAALTLISSVNSMAYDEFDLEHTRISAAQANQIELMIKDMTELQEEVGLTSDGSTNQVGSLTKIIEEAQIIYGGLSDSASEDEIDAAWAQVNTLKRTACKIATGQANCK
ncbi:hypothetical protein QJS83_09025 [Bdellovibrio sp. 22V]|uniref:hypothetical protein n=1 Tax=Bdellovibrio sp. 22V TaxID=3044166 RepID=UPI002543EAA4|nr:hypothetical protein [Bdellovibrio sp. 22V]WII70599.1 hypothetical protein QJS83_09025 [Bdellovibrio sp. 22V]